MEYSLRLNGIVEESIVDGPGLRFVVFTQGCFHNCKGCHNPETHAMQGGKEYLVTDIFTQFIENPLLSGITFSGGEPFLQSEALCVLGKKVKTAGKNIVTFTGFTYEHLLTLTAINPYISELIELTDLLVDGPYIESFRELDLDFRGSSNQRLLTREDRQRITQEVKTTLCSTILMQKSLAHRRSPNLENF